MTRNQEHYFPGLADSEVEIIAYRHFPAGGHHPFLACQGISFQRID
jgi:hypothetical protein